LWGTGFVGWLVVMVGAEEVVLGDGRELAETVGGKVLGGGRVGGEC